MKYIVCIKQVPDVAAPIHTGRMVLNAYDASAVEEALVLKEKYGGSVDLVLMGPSGAQETVRKALAMGADEATHLLVDDDYTYDSAAAAQILAAYLEGKGYDIIACGKQSQDSDAGLTGSMLAERLKLPYATNAVGLDLEGETLVVTRQGDVGQEILALPTPCLVTCSNDMNDPRIPTLKGIMGAKRKPLTSLSAADLLDDRRSMTQVRGYEAIPPREPGQMLQGEIEEMVQDLVDRLQLDNSHG